jgi:hypothetical protein
MELPHQLYSIVSFTEPWVRARSALGADANIERVARVQWNRLHSPHQPRHIRSGVLEET